MALSKIHCTSCGKELSEREFLYSSSKLYSYNSKIPLCKSCLNKRFKILYTTYNENNKQALQHFCYNLDLCYDEETYNEIKNENINMFAVEYIKRINRNRTNRERNSLDNPLYYLESNNKSNYIENIEKEPFEITDEILKRWGKCKFNPEELETLEQKYEELINEYPSDKYQEKEIIKDICQIEIQMDRAYKNKDHNAYAKFQNLKSEKMAELNVIPSKQKQYDEDKSMTLGQMIKRFEEEEPIPDTTEEFNDVDKIQFNINRYFIKPMRKALGIDKSKYTVEDELDTYENFVEKKKKSKKDK